MGIRRYSVIEVNDVSLGEQRFTAKDKIPRRQQHSVTVCIGERG